MDNVIMQSIVDFSDYAKTVKPSKKIKISERSQENMRAKIIPFRSKRQEEDITSKTQSVSTDVPGVNEVKPPVVEHKASALDNVSLENVYEFVPIVWVNGGYRQIRLTDSMNSKVVLNTAKANIEPVVGINDIVSESSEVAIDKPSEDIKSDDVVAHTSVANAIRGVVNQAFQAKDVAVPIVASFVDSNEEKVGAGAKAKDVKKASHSKAKIEKYRAATNETTNAPRFIVSGNDIFSKPTVAESQRVGKVATGTDRVVPIVVMDRDELVAQVDLMQQPDLKVIQGGLADKFSDAPSENITNVSSTEDEDIASILAEIQQLQKEEEEAVRSSKKEEKAFQTSVEELNASAQKVKNAKKERDEALSRAKVIKEALQAGVEENRRKADEFRSKTEQNRAAIRENTEIAERTAAGTKELRESMPKQLVKAA